METKKGEKVSSLVLEILLAALLPAGILLMVEALARGGVDNAYTWICTYPTAAFVNYVLWFIPANLFQFIKQRCWVWISQFTLIVVLACVAIGNMVKLNFRTTPLVLADFSVLDDAFEIAKSYLPGWNIPLLLGGIILMLVAFSVTVWRFCHSYTAGKYRFVFSAVVVIFIAVLAFPQSKAWINSKTWINGYSQYDNYTNNGFAWGFLQSTREALSGMEKPSNYTDSVIDDVFRTAKTTSGTGVGMDTNVIIILGESIMDVDMLSEIDFTKDPTPVLHRLLKEFPSGRVTVKWQGGGTCFAEASVLTGIPGVDYSNLVARQRTLPSLATVFKGNAYQTHALHPYYGRFYNRYDAMRLLGFDEFICRETFVNPTPVYGTWIRDAALYDETLDSMKSSEERDFCYLATMETHGDYLYEMDDGNWFTNNLSEQSMNNLNTYLSILNDADTALGEFLAELSAWEEPTVVMLFGDHIPSLGAGTYQEIGFDTTSPESFMTPYFIWSNFETTYEMTAEEVDMPIFQLGTYLLSRLGYDADPYFSVMIGAFENPEQDIWDDAANLFAYDLLYGKQRYLSLAGIDLSNPEYRIGYKMEPSDAVWRETNKGDVVQGRGDKINNNCELQIGETRYPISVSGMTWTATVPTNTLLEDELYEAEILIEDSRGMVISKSNMFSITKGQVPLTSDEARLAEKSLKIKSIYPGTELTQAHLKPDGTVDIGITCEAITESTAIYINETELHTVYGDTFISATIPAEIVDTGEITLYLYNYLLNEKTDSITLMVAKS